MRNLLHTYKLRLTNLSQGNRSLVLGRLSARRDIDFTQLGFLEKESAEEMLARLLADKDLTLIQKVDARHEPTNLADRRLNQIYREANTLLEETGASDLYLGYPFVMGRFLDGTVARCPVLLFPVRLVRDLQGRPRWKLERLRDEPVSFNRTFFLAYEQYHQARLKPDFWEEEIAPNPDPLTWINDLYLKIKEYEIEVNFNSDLFTLKLEAFPDYTKSTLENLPLGMLKFYPQAVLGVFPQSDSALLQDYKQLEEFSEQFDLDNRFTRPFSALKPQPYIPEEERYFISSLDQSQENALLKVKAGRSLVIYGPPGTGKSQVIVNMIADAIAQGKKVLLVSQKRAALDVVYKRLDAAQLTDFCILIHDYQQDRATIYLKLKRLIDAVETIPDRLREEDRNRLGYEYQSLSSRLDQYHLFFEDLFQALSDRKEKGISAHELYLATDLEGEILPMQSFARDWDEHRLRTFLEKLSAILSYKEFFHQDYPWKFRLSFRHYNIQDKQLVYTKLRALPEKILSLHTLYVALLPTLGENILTEKVNENRIKQYDQLDAQIQIEWVLKDIHALKSDGDPVAKTRSLLDQLDLAIQALYDRRYLDDAHWKFLDEMQKHHAAYTRLSGKNIRYISLAYQRARWFIGKILQAKGLDYNENNAGEVIKEMNLFLALQRLYTVVHQLDYMGDFPLLDVQEEKEEWMRQKLHTLQVYEQLTMIDYFPKLTPYFSEHTFEIDAWNKHLQAIRALDQFNLQLASQHKEWALFLHEEQIGLLIEGIAKPTAIGQVLSLWSDSFIKDFDELKALDMLLSQLSSVEQQVIDVLDSEIAKREKRSLLNLVQNSFYYFWIEQLEQLHPALPAVSMRGFEEERDAYAKKIEARRALVSRIIRKKLWSRIVDGATGAKFRDIYHQVSKKRRLWSVRKLVHQFWDQGLSLMTPCWMASPETVAAVFPMRQDFFDLVIFDEASQCFVERALPALLRGKQNIVAGDDKQLQPTDLYKARMEEFPDESEVYETALEVESILDLAKTIYEEVSLNWHYRSKHEALINFSNQAFYEGKLQMMPSPVSSKEKPLEWIQVPGIWADNRNLAEGERIIDLLKDLVQLAAQPSLGIVTFNYHQQELIRDLLDKTLESLTHSDPGLYTQMLAALNKKENEEFQGLFVKNIENVQGDERDIIIFSIGYAFNAQGKLSAQFGLLNQRGGENRLNVAITRARKKIYVVSSILPGELQVDGALHAGPRLLKQYLQYVYSLSGESQDFASLPAQVDLSGEKENLTERVYDALKEKGVILSRNIGATSFKLDLAVQDTQGESGYKLGIECEGTAYFSGGSPKEREVYRREMLEAKGWRIHRVWARNFRLNAEKEIERIISRLAH